MATLATATQAELKKAAGAIENLQPDFKQFLKSIVHLGKSLEEELNALRQTMLDHGPGGSRSEVDAADDQATSSASSLLSAVTVDDIPEWARTYRHVIESLCFILAQMNVDFDALHDSIDTDTTTFEAHIADTSDPHGATMSVSTKVQTPEVENTGNITIDAINAAADSTVSVLNSDGSYNADLDVEGDITLGGTVDGRDVATDGTKLDAAVIGPGSSTNHAAARYQSTTGKILEDSALIIDDSGNLSGIGNITLGGGVDGREVGNDGTKLDGIESNADVTDEANVTAALPVSDATSLVKDPGDGSKQVRLDVGAVAAATTRVVTVPNQDVDLTPNTGTFPAAAHAGRHTDGSDDVQDATSGQKGLATAAQITKLDGVETSADVTDATNVNDAGATMNADFNAHTILQATSDDTPVAITIAEERLVGRITSGNIVGLTQAQVRTFLGGGDYRRYAHVWYIKDPEAADVEIGFKVPDNSTIVRVDVKCEGGGSSATFNIQVRAEATPRTAGTDLWSSDKAIDTDHDIFTSFDAAAVEQYEIVFPDIVAVGGTVPDEIFVGIVLKRDAA